MNETDVTENVEQLRQALTSAMPTAEEASGGLARGGAALASANCWSPYAGQAMALELQTQRDA